MNERLKAIATFHGLKIQTNQLMEECCELAIECNHSKRRGKATTGLVGEIADVLIMIEQIKYLYNIEDEDIKSLIDYKINRELERIGYVTSAKS